MSKSASQSSSVSTQQSSSPAPAADKAPSPGATKNGTSGSGANGSVSGSTGSTTSSSTASGKQPTGPRRFRGDVPAFNPSSSGSPHIYHSDMRHYHPQSHGSQPMYPNQTPQFYSQQPQLMFNGQMMQPYYPMAMGYPDYSMYQPYQYYMANPYQAQGPVPYMNNVNGYTPNNANGNRKKHSRNNYYANYNSNSHNLHSTSANGKHPPQHHSSMSSYPSNSSNASTVAQDHSINTPGSYTSSSAASPRISSKDTKSSSYTPEPQQKEPANKKIHANLSRSSESPTQNDAHSPDVTTKTDEAKTNNDNDQSNAAQNNRSLPAAQTPRESSTKTSFPVSGPVPTCPVLFNISLKNFEQERLASLDSYQAYMQRKSQLSNVRQISDSATLFVDTNAQIKMINVDDGSKTIKMLCDQEVVNNFKPTPVTNNISNSTKTPMNWASLLSGSGKKGTTSKTKSSTTPVHSAEVQKTTKESNSASTDDISMAPGPQPLGLIAIMMLYDPSFDISAVQGFALKPRGLTNSGNICYMNAVLQCLMFCPTFNKIFHLIGEKSIGSLGGKSSTPLIDATITFLTDFVNVSAAQNGGSVVNADGIVVGRPLSPEKLYMKLIESPQFQHLTWGQQEDAEEFLGYFLDGLHEEFVSAEASVSPEKYEQLADSYGNFLDSVSATELKSRMKSASRLVRTTSKTEEKEESEDEEDITGKEWSEVGSKSQVSKKRVSEVEPSPITRLFGGKFRSVLTIPKGKDGNSITVDPFRCISVDISQDNVTTIEDALSQFNEIEKIPYKTEGGLEVVAKKQTFIDGLPEILILQLKRFSFRNDEQPHSEDHVKPNGMQGMGTIEKVMKTVQYGLDLTVAPEILSPSIRATAMRNYSLSGVIYHHGRNAEGGHYTCDVLRQGQKWLRIDDTAVEAIHASKVTEKPEARDKSAYILIYHRKGARDTSRRWMY